MPAGPRVVLVTRATAYQEMVRMSGSEGQAKFRRARALRSAPAATGGAQSDSAIVATASAEVDSLNVSNERFEGARVNTSNAIPSGWRQATVQRRELDRFPFDPDDIIVVIGQDGLVANVAKYLHGQPVIGLNPEPDVNPGVLVPHPPERAQELIELTADGKVEFEERTMVEAELDDGQKLVALNEVYLGHRSHQSSRYRIALYGREERQSSSGVIVATGTGATGWASSILRQRHEESLSSLPMPWEERLNFFVREAWPSPGTETNLVEGSLDDSQNLILTSELNDGGVIFGDGIEDDHLDFGFGKVAQVRVSDRRLRMVR